MEVKNGLAVDDLVVKRVRGLVGNCDLDGLVAGAARDDGGYLEPFLQQDENFPHVIEAETRLPAQIYRTAFAEGFQRGATRWRFEGS